MIKNTFYKICLIFIIYFTNITSINAATNSFIVIKIDNEIITNIDIQKEYSYLVALNPTLKSVQKEEILKLAKESLIKEKVKKKELLKYYDLDQTNPYLDKIITNMYEKLGLLDLEQFRLYLKNYNLSINEVKKKLEIETAWNELIVSRFRDQIDINSKKIKRNILTNENKVQKSFLLSEILFSVEYSKDIQIKYEEIKKSINNVGFKNSANIYSKSDTAKDGGSVGWINENQLSSKINAQIKNLKPGELSMPITTGGGQLILKLEDIKTVKRNVDVEKELNEQIVFERNRQLKQFSMIFFNKIKHDSKIK